MRTFTCIATFGLLAVLLSVANAQLVPAQDIFSDPPVQSADNPFNPGQQNDAFGSRTIQPSNTPFNAQGVLLPSGRGQYIGSLAPSQNIEPQHIEQLLQIGQLDQARQLFSHMMQARGISYNENAQDEMLDFGLEVPNEFSMSHEGMSESYKMIAAEWQSATAANALVLKYRQESDAAKKTEILAEINTHVERQFEAKLAIREHEVQELSARLDKVKAQLERRKQHAKEIIERRVKELTGQRDELDWDFGAPQAGLNRPLREVNNRYGSALQRPVTQYVPGDESLFPSAGTPTQGAASNSRDASTGSNSSSTSGADNSDALPPDLSEPTLESTSEDAAVESNR